MSHTYSHILITCIYRYEERNVKSSGMARKYDPAVPEFLHNKPQKFVKRCLKQLKASAASKICQSEEGFQVTSGNFTYEVSIIKPDCSCNYFQTKNMLCKHLLAVLHRNDLWEQLPEEWRHHNRLVLHLTTVLQSEGPGKVPARVPISKAKKTTAFVASRMLLKQLTQVLYMLRDEAEQEHYKKDLQKLLVHYGKTTWKSTSLPAARRILKRALRPGNTRRFQGKNRSLLFVRVCILI